jgi:hypothetical protein
MGTSQSRTGSRKCLTRVSESNRPLPHPARFPPLTMSLCAGASLAPRRCAGARAVRLGHSARSSAAGLFAHHQQTELAWKQQTKKKHRRHRHGRPHTQLAQHHALQFVECALICRVRLGAVRAQPSPRCQQCSGSAPGWQAMGRCLQRRGRGRP